MTAVFLFVIMGATDKRAPVGFAPMAIGLALTLIHLIRCAADPAVQGRVKSADGKAVPVLGFSAVW